MFQFPAAPTVGQLFSPLPGIIYQFDGTGWILTSSSVGAAVPSGVVLPYAGPAALPAGWLFCDGASYATAAQPSLFAAISYTYGGSGANFNVPDLRGRAVAGRDDMGGTPANRLTAAGGGFSAVALGSSGGAQGVVLTVAQMPSHFHTIPQSPGGGVQSGGGATAYAGAAQGTSAVGGDGLHTNVQPTLILNYIIKT